MEGSLFLRILISYLLTASALRFIKQELGINPQTFTPEVLLSVARVVKVDLNVAPMTVSFQSIERPGASEAALSFGFGSVDKGMDCADEEAFVETTSWPVILESQWRCISVG